MLTLTATSNQRGIKFKEDDLRSYDTNLEKVVFIGTENECLHFIDVATSYQYLTIREQPQPEYGPCGGCGAKHPFSEKERIDQERKRKQLSPSDNTAPQVEEEQKKLWTEALDFIEVFADGVCDIHKDAIHVIAQQYTIIKKQPSEG